MFKVNRIDDKCYFVKSFLCLLFFLRRQQWLLFIILGEHIFSDTVLWSCVAVLCNSLALPVCDAQRTKLVLVILFCCEPLYCSILISGKVSTKVGPVAQSV